MVAIGVRRLVRRERGASYSLGFVIIVPFFLLFLVAVFEVSFLLLAKVGTQYAAFAGARSAVVWESAHPAELRRERLEQSVYAAMAPFVGGREREIASAGPPPAGAAEQAADYAELVRRAGRETGPRTPNPARSYRRNPDPPDAEHLARRYLHAASRTTVRLETADPADPRNELTVTVTFRAPLYFPIASRFLDPDGRAPFEFPITSRATLPADGPRSPRWPERMPPVRPDRPIGIDYLSARE